MIHAVRAVEGARQENDQVKVQSFKSGLQVPDLEMPPEDEPEVMVLGQSEDPERVAPNIAPGATGVAAAFEGGLDAG